jgi:hypothetical protein
MFYERRKFAGRLLWVFDVPFNLVRTGGELDLKGGNTFLEPKSILSERNFPLSCRAGRTALQFIHRDRVDEIAPYDSVLLMGANGDPEQLHKFCWWPES